MNKSGFFFCLAYSLEKMMDLSKVDILTFLLVTVFTKGLTAQNEKAMNIQ